MSETAITIEAISGALDQSCAQIHAVLARLSDPLSGTPDEGGWTIRQLLSHLIGALQRVPVHSGFFLNGNSSVPIEIGDSYWIPEWETAPLISFASALTAAQAGMKAFISSLSADELQRILTTPFGDMPLGQFLMISVSGHPAGFHGAQLEAFAAGV